MPYLGNSPVAGDHTNNFKVLDDISSYTETFDGSATTIVSTSNNTIRAVDHRFIQGQRVTYTNGGGGNIGGLTTGTAYFIIFDTASTFKLATSASNAANSVAINLSSVGSGSSHTLNVAFDGVNTKFKITYNNGTAARFNNATQLNIAINNVLQKPNNSSLTFTEGFAIEDSHKIVFKIAPTSQDIFWGSIIANTLTTFDISDHKIDTFTGDGSTTEFTLSHVPTNNESLMVSINGVLQHPSNSSTVRAYTLIESIIQFTAAPANGDEIQVRHLGFAGATTADVSGFYGRTGNVALTSNDHITTGDITARNINASGIITASSANFSGNVSIGGTLTYEDVTNIDSVGIITARNGIDCNGDIDVDGHTNLDNVSVAGVTTFSDDVYFDGATADRDIIFDRSANTLQVKRNAILKIGQGSYSTDLYTDGTNTFFDHNQNSALFVKSNIFQVYGTGNGYDGTIFRCIQGKTELGYEVPNGGATTLDNLVTSEKGVTVGTGVTIERNGNSNFVGVSSLGTGDTGAVYLYNPADDELSATTNDDYGWKAKTYKDGLQINSKLYLSRSGSNGLALTYNNATGSYITANSGFLRLGVPYGGYFNIYSNQIWLKDRLQTTTFALFEKVSNSLWKSSLYSNNQVKLNIEPSGISVVGTTTSTQLAVTGVSTFTGQARFNGEIVAGGVISVQTGGSINIPDKLIHSGDTDTMIRFPANDTITFETAGSERLRMTSAGDLGLGINNPARHFHLHVDSSLANYQSFTNSTTGASSSDGFLLGINSSEQGIIWNYENTSLRIATNNAERLTITSGGFLGIGIDTPQRLLHQHIADSGATYHAFTNSTTGSGINDGMVIGISGSEEAIFWNYEATPMRFSTSGTERLRIDANGNMALGKGSSTSTNYGTNFQIHSNSTSGAALHLTDNTTGSGTGDGFHIISTSGIAYLWQRENSHMVFATNGTERLRITSTGRVNIGDNDQSQNVDQFSVTIGATNAIDNVARFQSTAAPSGTSESLVKIYKGAGYGGVISGYITQGSDHGLKLYTANNGALSERFRINSNGIITKPNNPAFRANREGSDATINSGSIQQWNNVSGSNRSFDRYTTGGYGFNTSTHKYKVPVTGVWYFHAAVYTNTGYSCMFDIRTSTQLLQRAEDNSGSNMPNNNIVHASVVTTCNKDDEVYVIQSGGQCQMIQGTGYISFDGYFIG